MTNTLRRAGYYQLAFNNNLIMTEVDNQVGWLGTQKDQENFYNQLEDKEEERFWFSEARHSEDYDRLDGYVVDNMEEHQYLLEKQTPNEVIEDLNEMTKGGIFKAMGLDEDGDDLLDEKLRYNDQHDLID